MTKPEPGPLEGLLKGIVARLDGAGMLTKEAVQEAWEEAAGKKAASHARPLSLSKGVLTVNVDGSSWLYELTTKKRELVKKMQDRIKSKKFKDIRFRIGELK